MAAMNELLRRAGTGARNAVQQVTLQSSQRVVCAESASHSVFGNLRGREKVMATEDSRRAGAKGLKCISDSGRSYGTVGSEIGPCKRIGDTDACHSPDALSAWADKLQEIKIPDWAGKSQANTPNTISQISTPKSQNKIY